MAMEEDMDTDQKKQEAIRLKSVAETKYATDSNLKSALKHVKKAHKLYPSLEGLSSMLTAFKILRVASMSNSDIKDWYAIFQVEPFSHINTIKKQYKKLALILHPDKNPFFGCEEAFKLVGEGFRVLSDKIRRKEYDLRLRIKLQEERVCDNDNNSVVETFWTACSRCRLLHQFERSYLGHILVCPSCKKSFEAVEVEEEKSKEDNEVGVRFSERLKRKVVGDERFGNFGTKRKMGSVGEVVEESDSGGLMRKAGGGQKVNRRAKDLNLEVKEVGSGEWSGGRLRGSSLRRKTSTVNEVLERSRPKKMKFADEMMTLAELQLEVKQKALQEKEKLKEKQKDVTNNKREKEEEKLVALKKLRDVKNAKSGASKKSEVVEFGATGGLGKSRSLEIERHTASRKSVNLKIEQYRVLKNRDSEIVAAEDSDFLDFELDKSEMSFKKGQIWAMYDDDRMPRRYGLIDDVISMNPFVVKLSWLDLQSNGDEELVCWANMGFRVSSGRFKVSRRTTINSLNNFSHVVDCEREAREVYRIYPKKGSVWALYNEVDLGVEERNVSPSDKQCYEIAVFLTTYSEMHGLSMAYLEKVDGFNSVYRRREIGCHAIRWLGKDDVRLLSHQIPARKLSADETPALLNDCWELDPALVPSHLLTIN